MWQVYLEAFMQDVFAYVSINFEWLPWNCKRSCSIHATPEKFEKGVNHSETHQMFSIQTWLEKFENATITGHFGVVFEEIVTSSFWKSSILKMFSIHIKTQSWCFQIPRVWTVFSFEECPFSRQIIVDGRPNHRNKAAFSNFSCIVWMRP